MTLLNLGVHYMGFDLKVLVTITDKGRDEEYGQPAEDFEFEYEIFKAEYVDPPEELIGSIEAFSHDDLSDVVRKAIDEGA